MNSRVYSTVKPTPEPEPFKPVKPLDALPLGLALQPGLLRRMGKHPEAREQGFSARFLYSIPDSKAGSRLYQNRRIDPAAANIYRNTLQRLLQIPAVTMVDEPPEFPELALTGEGREVWRDYHDATEKAMRPGGPLAVMVERGFIRQLPPEPATGPGRPKGARFQVNPSFYV